MSVIDEYLQTVDEPQKADLERIRQIVKQMAPEAEEGMSYGMPTFKYKKKYLVGFCAYKDHMSLFPTPGPIAVLKDKLADFKLAKGTIQFTHDQQIPGVLIQEIIRTKLAEITKGRA